MRAHATPRVSMAVPVYNGERYLGEALDSLLAQTYHDFELIICDNASTDGTGEIARSYASMDERVRYVRNERDRKSTRLNSSHGYISYAVFCLKKKKIKKLNIWR